MEILTDLVAWFFQPFSDYGFMRSALAAGLLASITLSLVGTWIVLRGMSFLGEALAHGVLPGIAIAIVIGANTAIGTSIGAFTAAIILVTAVHMIRSRSPLPEDTSIGILFVGFLALAIVIVSSQSGSYFGDLNRFLFGSITGVTTADLQRLSAATLLTVVVVRVFYRAFLVTTFDESLAKVLHLRPHVANAMLMVLLAVAIVSSFNVVGNLLVFAFLVAPPAAAAMVMNRVNTIILTATVISAASVTIGLLLSYHYDTAGAATMALVAVASFIIALAYRQFRLTSCYQRLIRTVRMRSQPITGG